MWSLDVDPSETRLATGCSDTELRVYAINAGADAPGEQGGDDEGPAGQRQRQQQAGEPHAGAAGDFLVPMGSMRRQGTDRAETVRYAAVPGAHGGVLLTCQSAGKVTEVYRVRSAAEAAKKMKRRRRRKREKAEKKAAKAGEQGEEEAAGAGGAEVWRAWAGRRAGALVFWRLGRRVMGNAGAQRDGGQGNRIYNGLAAMLAVLRAGRVGCSCQHAVVSVHAAWGLRCTACLYAALNGVRCSSRQHSLPPCHALGPHCLPATC